MKQIFLLRHAKSDWSTMGQQDFDRGLASRGIKDISLISDYVKKNNFKLDEVLCSSANRTKETFDLCADGFDFDIKNAKYYDELYYGNHESIIDLLVNVNQSANSVLVVGHNPTMHILLEQLTGLSIIKYPTSTLAQIILQKEWKDLLLKVVISFMGKWIAQEQRMLVCQFWHQQSYWMVLLR